MEIPKEIKYLVNLRQLSLQSNSEVEIVVPTEINNILKIRNCVMYV